MPTGKVLSKAGGVMARPRRDLRAGWGRKRPTAAPEQPGLLRLRRRDNNAVRRRAAEVEGRPRQEAANCVAQTARLSQPPGEGQ
jgi:hypothetical protein